MSKWTPIVGQRVRALVDIDDDLNNHGVGFQLLARKGDEMTIKDVSSIYTYPIQVSHNLFENREFSVKQDEIEPIEVELLPKPSEEKP